MLLGVRAGNQQCGGECRKLVTSAAGKGDSGSQRCWGCCESWTMGQGLREQISFQQSPGDGEGWPWEGLAMGAVRRGWRWGVEVGALCETGCHSSEQGLLLLPPG